MTETRTAKLFKNGASQAVRLPAEFRFDGDEVYVTRDASTGNVVLSSRPGAKAWGDFFEFVRSIAAPNAFMADRPMNKLPHARGVFDDQIARPKKRTKRPR